MCFERIRCCFATPAARLDEWARRRIISASRRRCSASATRRPSWRAGSWRRRSSLEDRRDEWRRIGERICAGGAADARRLCAARCEPARRCTSARRSTCGGGCARTSRDAAGAGSRPEFARAADAEWQEVGSELEALLREAALIRRAAAGRERAGRARRLSRRARVPAALVARRRSWWLPSVEADSVGLVARARRRRLDDSADAPERRRPRGPRRAAVAVLQRRPLDGGASTTPRRLAPLVFSWLAGRGAAATRLDPHDAPIARAAARAARGAARGRAAVRRADRCARSRLSPERV